MRAGRRGGKCGVCVRTAAEPTIRLNLKYCYRNISSQTVGFFSDANSFLTVCVFIYYIVSGGTIRFRHAWLKRNCNGTYLGRFDLNESDSLTRGQGHSVTKQLFQLLHL